MYTHYMLAARGWANGHALRVRRCRWMGRVLCFSAATQTVQPGQAPTGKSCLRRALVRRMPHATSRVHIVGELNPLTYLPGDHLELLVALRVELRSQVPQPTTMLRP